LTWTELLKGELTTTYALTKRLMDMVEDENLDWKPSEENNWMTTGQLMMHLTNACGSTFKGFVTGDWGFPTDSKSEDLPPEEMLLPAEKLPAVKSVAEAKALLEDDEKVSFEMLSQCPEERLSKEMVTAPWSPIESILGLYLFQMVEHLKQHRHQLFYYLKLQGKPVNTSHLWML
jgi:hypothetical protein